MASSFTIPEHLITRFRAVSFDRLERIDAAWIALKEGTATPGMESELYRDLHTLKGDARVIGFAEIGSLCQKLEDLLAVARGCGYRVADDFDVVVTMATQFVGMLLRKKAGTSKASGIDLDAFLKQIDECIDEARRSQSVAPSAERSSRRLRLASVSSRMPVSTRQRLSVVATAVFLEHLRVPRASAERLLQTWAALANEIAELDAVSLATVTERHVAAGEEIAASLGKQVKVLVDVGELRVRAEALDAINTAVIHCVRNAIDHGVEMPSVRASRGKPPVAMVRVDAQTVEGGLELCIRDDGGGVEIEGVRRKAVALGLLSAVEAASASRAGLLELLFHPGFSTRDSASEISGRGIGLDAVRAAIERVGGRVAIDTHEGVGTRVTLHVPESHTIMDVVIARAAYASFVFAVPATWEASIVDGAIENAVAPSDLLDIPRSDDSRVTLRTLVLKRGADEARLLVSAAPTRASAMRRCPTPPDTATEIVEVDGAQTILLRPELFSR